MNDNARGVYRPAPPAGAIKCLKCGREMVPSAKHQAVSTCACGSQVKRKKLA